MPSNKNALTRYRFLDEMLSDRHHYFDIHDLTERCNNKLYEAGFPEVTRRCIEKDLQYMEYEPFNAEIERFWKNGRKCIRYANPGFSIFQKELTDEESNLLVEVLNTIGQFDGLANFEWIDRLRIGLRLRERRKIISFSHNPRLQNSNLLGTLFDCIANEVVVGLSYRKFTDHQPNEHVVHPYLLKQYDDRWFLFAANDENHKVLNFALDRIVSVAPLPDEKYHPCEENPEEWFRDIVGVTRFEYMQLMHIVFWANDRAMEYVRTKPIHLSQKELTDEEDAMMRGIYTGCRGGHFFSLDCIPNYELIRELCAFGKQLIVVEPRQLHEQLLEEIGDMLKSYSDIHR